jgi:hypothetical protein
MMIGEVLYSRLTPQTAAGYIEEQRKTIGEGGR